MIKNLDPNYCSSTFAQVVYMLRPIPAWQRQANKFKRMKNQHNISTVLIAQSKYIKVIA